MTVSKRNLAELSPLFQHNQAPWEPGLSFSWSVCSGATTEQCP